MEAAGFKSICCVGADTRRVSAEPAGAQQSPAEASKTCQHKLCLKGFDWQSGTKQFMPATSERVNFEVRPSGRNPKYGAAVGTDDDGERPGG